MRDNVRIRWVIGVIIFAPVFPALAVIVNNLVGLQIEGTFGAMLIHLAMQKLSDALLLLFALKFSGRM